jgi:FAD/FMN-containing dehydrogenase
VSGLVRADAGLSLPDLEAFLVRHRFSLTGLDWPLPSIEFGSWLEARGAGCALPRATGLAARVLSYHALLAAGSAVSDGRAPRSAAGIDLRPLWIGARGAFGLLVEATISVYRLAPCAAFEVSADSPAKLVAVATRFVDALGPADALIFLPGGTPSALLYLGWGATPEIALARAAYLGRVASVAAIPIEGANLEERRARYAGFLNRLVESDSLLGPRIAAREVALEPSDAADWLREPRCHRLLVVESPRCLRGIEPAANDSTDPQPLALPARFGPMERLAERLHASGRWNR